MCISVSDIKSSPDYPSCQHISHECDSLSVQRRNPNMKAEGPVPSPWWSYQQTHFVSISTPNLGSAELFTVQSLFYS